jgi:hypothetical protein
MIVFQAEHNILMHPFHMLGVAGVFGGRSSEIEEEEEEGNARRSFVEENQTKQSNNGFDGGISTGALPEIEEGIGLSYR